MTSLVDKTAHEIALGLDQFLLDRQPNELVVVYFSCHGFKDANGRFHFAATNTTRLFPSTALDDHTVLRRLDDCRAKQQVLFRSSAGKNI